MTHHCVLHIAITAYCHVNQFKVRPLALTCSINNTAGMIVSINGVSKNARVKHCVVHTKVDARCMHSSSENKLGVAVLSSSTERDGWEVFDGQCNL